MTKAAVVAQDAGLVESAAELAGLAAAGESFIHLLVILVPNEDAVGVAVEAEWDAEAAQQALEQMEIAASVLGGEEFSDENFACDVVLEAEQGKLRDTILQLAVQAGVAQQHLAFASAREAALALAYIGGASQMQSAVPHTLCRRRWLSCLACRGVRWSSGRLRHMPSSPSRWI